MSIKITYKPRKKDNLSIAELALIVCEAQARQE